MSRPMPALVIDARPRGPDGHRPAGAALGRHPECESAAADRVCASYRTPPLNENDIEFRNDA